MSSLSQCLCESFLETVGIGSFYARNSLPFNLVHFLQFCEWYFTFSFGLCQEIISFVLGQLTLQLRCTSTILNTSLNASLLRYPNQVLLPLLLPILQSPRHHQPLLLLHPNNLLLLHLMNLNFRLRFGFLVVFFCLFLPPFLFTLSSSSGHVEKNMKRGVLVRFKRLLDNIRNKTLLPQTTVDDVYAEYSDGKITLMVRLDDPWLYK